MKSKLFCVAVIVLSAAMSMATTIISTEVVMGVTSTYDASANTLIWGDGIEARLFTTDGQIFFDSASVTAQFTGGVDTSSGGTASAVFDSGIAWQIVLGSGGSDVLILSGTTSDYYNEVEMSDISGSTLIGGTDSSVDIQLLDPSFFGGIELEWADSISITSMTIGIRSSVASLINNLNLDDYSENWYSSNVKLDLVPEPATVMLLAAGGFIVSLRKRRSL